MTEPCATQSTRPAADPQEDTLRFPSPPAPASAWSPTDRWEWAATLPVRAPAKAVAHCIARHANNLTGLAWPGIARISEETGFKRTAVIAGIQELERGGHLTVSRLREGKKNRVNKYQLPPMGSPSNALGGSPSNGPESVSSSESVKKKKKKSCSRARAREATVENGDPERLICETCGNDWPAKYGGRCHECTPSQRRRAAQRKRDRESEKAPTPMTPEPEERPEPEEELGKQEERIPAEEHEDHPKILKTPEGPESAKEAIGDAEVSDLAWRDRLDKIETPTFSVRVLNRSATCTGDTAYTFPDGSRVLAYRKRWHHAVHKTRLKDTETLGRYTGHQIATAWVHAGYGLTEEDAGPVAQKETGFAPISPRLPRAFAEIIQLDSVSAALSRVQPETPDSRLTV